MSRSILLCDDEIHILRAAEIKFTHAGFDVRTAGDGEEAWQKIAERRPDVVVTDCQMPRLDGLGLIRRLRETPETKTLPVLMLTGKGFELPADQLAREWNVSGVMAKPFSPRELLQTVEKILAALEALKQSS